MLPIRRRLLALGLLSALGAVTFLPFLAAGGQQQARALGGFAVIVTVVATVAAWVGLRCADAVGLPMPYLRWLDGGAAPTIPRAAVVTTLLLSIASGLLGLLALHLVKAPALPGSAWTRILSMFFAAGPLEIILHLGVMSLVVWIARGRRWIGILVAALTLVGFHLTGGGIDQPPFIVITTVVGNGAIGLILGWVYATYGFEYAMLGHAVAHLITVLGG